jgi:predicted membrane-bound spermidine synthase
MSSNSTRNPSLFFAVFTISGFSGLIYESIWSHYLKLFLGHAAYAQTLVLAIFMGGMALGSWLTARRSHRIPNLLLGYAIVEGVIGLFGLLFHPVSIEVTGWAFNSVLPHIGSPATAQLVKWSLGALLILPQSVLLGTTFPLMSGAIVRRFPERAGATLAMLYFTNSLGAAIGVLVSGFVLIGAVGLPGTILTAALLNVALALLVWGIVKYQPDTVQAAPAAPLAAKNSLPGIARWMLIGAALTGVASFFYEIAWIRMLSLVLGSSTHSFEMMLSAFILGIALGGLWVHRRIDSLRDPVRFLGTILVIMAVVAMLSLPVYDWTFEVMGTVFQTFTPTEPGYIGISVSSHAIAMLVMIPTTFFCGMTLPLMTHVLIRQGSGEQAIGSVYAWNTAGAIVGVIVAVHLLMPAIGVKGLVIAGAAIQLILAVVYRSTTAVAAERWKRAAVPAAAAMAGILLAALFLQLTPERLASGVFRHGMASVAADSKVIFLEHGKTATVSLVDRDGHVSIATNGKPDAAIMMKGPDSTIDEITMSLAGAIPYALHRNPRHVANIGFGSGLTSHVLLASPALESLDTIEIEPLMVRAAEIGFRPRVFRVFTDPRSHIHYEDAKTFFAMNQRKYDVIVSEPSNPWVSGVSTLFSQEFYRQITHYLESDGLLVQWIQIYEVDLDIVQSIIKALAPEFSDFALYNTGNSDLLLVATRSGTLPRIDSRVFEIPGLRAELARLGVSTPEHIASRFLGNKKLLMPLLAESGVPANSDYFPYVDIHAARARFLRRSASEIVDLETLPLPFFELLAGAATERSDTQPSVKPASSRDEMGVEAVALRRALETGQYDRLDAPTARVLYALQVPKEQCSTPAMQRTWLASVYHLAASTNAPLSGAELKSMWDRIAALPCAGALSSDDRRMFSFLQYVAQRDVQSAASTGTELFAGGYAFAEPAQMSFAMMATAASDIALNQPAAALEVIRENNGRVSETPSSALAVRWLIALARQSIQSQPPRSSESSTRLITDAAMPNGADKPRQ